jgi:hypothetical protein
VRVRVACELAAHDVTDHAGRDRVIVTPSPHGRLVNRPVTGEVEHLTTFDMLDQRQFDWGN